MNNKKSNSVKDNNSSTVVTNAKIIEPDKYSGNTDFKEVIVPKGVVVIDDRAFLNCSNLRKITLPSTLTHIGASAFAECKNLEEIVIPEGVTEIDYCAFNNCSKLKKVVLPNSLKKIEWGAFSDCISLEEINIPNQIKTIEKKTFNRCIKLDIELPSTVIELEEYVFNKCESLTHFPTHVEKFGNHCFNECTGLESAILGDKVKFLPENMFLNCTNIKEVKCNHIVEISQECFRGCSSLEVFPVFVKNLPAGAFDGCTSLKEVTIISPSVGNCCFYDCINLERVNCAETIEILGDSVFKNCVSLKEIDLSHIAELGMSVFEGCIHLEKVVLSDIIDTLPPRVFYECKKLRDITIPESIQQISEEAFRYCTKIKELHIPAELRHIGYAALASMESLQRFDVDKANKIFDSPDGILLINRQHSSIVSYAAGSRKKTCNIHKQVILKENGKEVIYPITTVLPYAFSGARNLHELILNSCTSELDINAFYECPNLKKMTIVGVEMFSAIGFRFDIDYGKSNFLYKNGERLYENHEYPFEEVEIKGHVLEILRFGFDRLVNLKSLILPSKGHTYYIEDNAFTNCKKLKQVLIPDTCIRVNSGAFPSGTVIKFPFKYGTTHFDSMNYDTGSGKLYQIIKSNSNRCFCLKRATTNPKTVYITDVWDIEQNIPTNSELAKRHPDMYVDYLEELKKHKMDIPELRDGYLVSLGPSNKEILFKRFKKNRNDFLKLLKDSKILEHMDNISTDKIFGEKNLELFFEYLSIFKRYNIDDPEIRSVVIIGNVDPKEFEEMCKKDLNLMITLFKNTNIIDAVGDKKSYNQQVNIARSILDCGKFFKFFELLLKYGVKDPYIQNNVLIANVENPLVEELIKYYDANVKRLLKASEYFLPEEDSFVVDKDKVQNLNDLLTYMAMMGSFDEDPIVRQRANTFITEKSLTKLSDNPQLFIGGDDIHRIFESTTYCGYKKGFTELFMQNYEKFIHQEKEVKSGIIARIYTKFEDLEEHNTSNKGAQRKLKLTYERALLLSKAIKFTTCKENFELADIVGEWFDSEETWSRALELVRQSEKAPRNIFTPIDKDKEGNPVYDYDPNDDLVGKPDHGFYYEWLPKQDYQNLILGKLCNCCAHLEGAGNGIMRASILLDCCQNLVIRCNGRIIAKSTLYINKDEGYGVFNNVEVSYRISDEKDRETVYKQFLEGANAFIETYNKNFPDQPISVITIGTRRNGLNSFLNNDEVHAVSKIKQGLRFGKYAFNQSGYEGDWTVSQRVVIRAKKEDQR